MILPDGEELTKARENTLSTGLDHYWRFHTDETEWINLCPVCKMKQEENLISR